MSSHCEVCHRSLPESVISPCAICGLELCPSCHPRQSHDCQAPERQRGLTAGYKLTMVWRDGHQWTRAVDFSSQALDVVRRALSDEAMTCVLVSNMNSHKDQLIRTRRRY